MLSLGVAVVDGVVDMAVVEDGEDMVVVDGVVGVENVALPLKIP